jgi:predicted AlkP superfamily phosphohydrolase/phosphomutase
MEKLKVFLTIFIIFLFLGLVLQEYINKEKLILISVDALEWKVINRLIDEGNLPNLKRFIEEGSYGNLKSPYSYSPISWTNILTGKTKEKHGVLDFGINNIPVRTYDVKAKRVWDYLNDNGIRIGVYGHYFTWPVEKVNGFMIADYFSSKGYALNKSYYPETLKEIVDKNSDTGHNVNIISEDCSSILYLFERFKPEFYTFLDNEIHIVTHSYWKYFNPKKFNVANEDEISDGYSKIVEAYSELDDCIGRIEESAKGYDIIIVSDHGMGDKINISYYLSFDQLFFDMGITNIIVKYPYIDEAYEKEEDIKYFVNFTLLDSSKRKEDIKKSFERIHYLDGTAFFENVTLNSDSIIAFLDWNKVKKNFVRNASRLSLDYYILLTTDNRNVTTTVQFREKSGEHYPNTDGVFIAKGPHIKKNFRIANISVYDVTPTMLYLYSINVPEDMDGRVLKDIIIRAETVSLLSFLRTSFLNFLHSESEEEKKEYVNVSGGNDKVFELLRSLGYSL